MGHSAWSFPTPHPIHSPGPVERHDIDLGDNVQRKVTASFGCAWLPDVRRPGDLVVKLLEDANAQLHRAKRRGGNYVATAVDPVPKRIKKKKT